MCILSFTLGGPTFYSGTLLLWEKRYIYDIFETWYTFFLSWVFDDADWLIILGFCILWLLINIISSLLLLFSWEEKKKSWFTLIKFKHILVLDLIIFRKKKQIGFMYFNLLYLSFNPYILISLVLIPLMRNPSI